ncbi:MAG: hypothetical protein LBT81_02325 [Helicobacteraceae bacterium]|jgi:hypothetical protein|nr:hypothetical protein [Helicobacteraceae bacterium]
MNEVLNDMRYFAKVIKESPEILAVIGEDYKVYIGAHDKDFSNLPLPNVILYPREIEYVAASTALGKQFIYFVEAAIEGENDTAENDGVNELSGQLQITAILEVIANVLWQAAGCTNAFDVSVDTAINPAIQDRVYSGSVALRYRLSRVIGGGFMPLRS